MDAVIENQLGTVQQISGSLKVIRTDGSEQTLLPGDSVFQGDVVIAEGGPALLSLGNGRTTEVSEGSPLDLGSLLTLSALGFEINDSALAQTDLFDEINNLPSPTAGEELPDEPTGAGEPTIPSEPPAAGTPQNGRFSPGVDLGLNSDEVEVQFGFDTTAPAQQAFFRISNQADAAPRDTSVTLTGTPLTLTEAGGIVTFTATLANASQGNTIINTTLGTIIIGDGLTSGSFDYTITDGEDVFLDPDSINNQIESASGGGFNEIVIDEDIITVSIDDTIDETTLTLTATPTTSEDGGSITYTATLSNVDGLPVANHNGLTVTLANQQQITIQAGATSGT
ncbi:immunoglobulin-like domain-containing protein, partial [Parendozoicomonas haliclonae]